MKYLALLLLISPAFGQSITTSGGGRSIMMSSRPVSPVVAPIEPVSRAFDAELAALQREIVELRQQLSARDSASRPVVTVAKPDYVVMFTASYCQPCQQWKRTEKTKLKSRGIQVVEIEMTDPANYRWRSQVSSYPTFWVCDGETQTRSSAFVGYVSADSLEQTLTAKTKIKSNDRKTVERTKITTTQPAGVLYNGAVYTGRVCSNPNCKMCNQIQRGLESQSRYQPMSIKVEPAQEGTPYESIGPMLDAMHLGREDVLADLGCGDGRILVAAGRRGHRGIGIEIDPVQSRAARQAVRDAGLEHLITIETGDARDFDVSRATAVVAYLYPELLDELAPKLKQARVAASVFHQVDGFEPVGDVWIHRRSDYVAANR